MCLSYVTSNCIYVKLFFLNLQFIDNVKFLTRILTPDISDLVKAFLLVVYGDVVDPLLEHIFKVEFSNRDDLTGKVGGLLYHQAAVIAGASFENYNEFEVVWVRLAVGEMVEGRLIVDLVTDDDGPHHVELSLLPPVVDTELDQLHVLSRIRVSLRSSDVPDEDSTGWGFQENAVNGVHSGNFNVEELSFLLLEARDSSLPSCESRYELEGEKIRIEISFSGHFIFFPLWWLP